jgi:hypothetical protein
MKKFVPAVILFLSLGLFSCGGRNYEEAIKVPEQLFYSGKYLEAAQMLLPDVNKSGKDQLLFMMECGYMLHAGADYAKSNKVFLPAGKLARIIPTSVTQQATSFLLNDRSTNYQGEDFEKVLVHMYLGINFLMLKDSESARVEFKLVNEELQQIRTENGEARYKQNIMAKYLTAIAYEIVGDENRDQNDLEYAYKEYEQIYALNPGLDMVRIDLQRLAKKLNYMDDYAKWAGMFGKRDNIPQDAGELITIYQSGLGAIKKSRGKLLSDESMKSGIYLTVNKANLATGVTVTAILLALHNIENPIPVFERRSDQTAYLRINVNGRLSQTIQMEDVATTAIKNLEDDYGRLHKRVAASVATKAIASVAAGIAAQQIAKRAGAGGFSNLIGTVAGAGTGAALFSQIKPDLRCWHTLPARLQMGRTFLRPGNYNISIDYMGPNGEIQGSKSTQVEIKKGQKSFINERTLM